VHKRLRHEAGFGLIELLMAMTILNVGILAVVAAFNSGIVTLRRSGVTATASVLADKQMELYRSLTYGSIALDPSSIPSTTPYTSDSAYSASQVTITCTAPIPAQCNASQTTTGPDHHAYRVDSYIVDDHPAGSAGRTVRRVTVVVRDGRHLANVLARSTSTFDCSTALPYAPGCPTT
jgi:Tfp pilus assembly protein PilE